MTVSQRNGGLVLEGDCQIDTAELLHTSLLALIEQGQKKIPITIRELTSIDVSVLQVLLTAKIHLEKNGGTLVLAPSPILRRLLQNMGLDDNAL